MTTSITGVMHLVSSRASLGIILLVGGISRAQSPEEAILPRLQGPIQLDGLSDEPAWQAVEPLPLTVHQPVFGGSPTERTEIRIAYDDDYLYASGRFYDSDPDGIRGNALERDGGSPSDDSFTLILDTFNDNETALGFVTTPTGNRIDFTLSRDAQLIFRPGVAPSSWGMHPGNMSWNTYWDVAVEQNEEGWFTELRIPFSSLRFQDNGGKVVMGLITSRYIARKNETVSYPAIQPKWAFGTMKPSIAQDIVLEGVYSRNPLYITPYALTGKNQSYQLNSAGSSYDLIDQPSNDVGLDLKYGITSNLTLDLTVNTDFAQVEADDERINLTRYSLFFPEKRLFFQERASIFDLNIGPMNNLFYSRRIGLSEHGPVPIHGGARLVGRVGQWDMGLLDMQTAQAEFVTEEDTLVTIPSENFGVLRLRRQVLNENSFTGGMITSRIGQDGSANYAYGLDGILRLFGDEYITLGWVQTFGNDEEEREHPWSAARFYPSWERRTRSGLAYEISYTYQGAAYNPGVGFKPRDDYYWIGRNISYAWMPPETSPVYRHNARFDFSLLFRNEDSALESALLGPSWFVEWKSGGIARIAARMRFEDLPETLDLPEGNFVPPGTYSYYELDAFYQMSWSKLLRTGLNFTSGSFYDGWYLEAGANPSWTISRFLGLSGNYQFTRARFPDRDQGFDTHIIGLRVQARLNTSLSLNAFIQYNSAADAIGINTRLRYNPREGTDLYLVYNEGLNTDRYGSNPVPPLSSSRTILLKYSTTFLPRLAWTAW
ncbi:MAG: carbohydrate binding family 9 domain-containing protein [Fidelibacterota bacterium]|nr:MAG: carbohydrate binding family 9 domain-containing protein [Candidatus Neomarinimicrobiota bacterium]